MSVPSEHPPRQLIESYSLGCLDDDGMVQVEEHLAACSTCAALADQTQDDEFCCLLRKHGSELLASSRSPSSQQEGVVGGPADRRTAMETQRRLDELRQAFADEPDLVLGRILGEGGMGVVFEATWSRSRLVHRTVAVKTLNPLRMDQTDLTERFREEVRALEKVRDHSHVVQVLTDGTVRLKDNTVVPYAVMEFVPGENLFDRVDREGPLSPQAACRVFRQAVLALQALSQANVVHRDIKPSNFIVTSEEREVKVKLVDFGLASLNTNESNSLTRSTDYLGTVDYQSPEQARDPHSADVRSDIYSLGCTFYFVLVGHPPFEDGNRARKIQDHLSTPPRPLHERHPKVPRALSHLVDQMLAKSPNDRFQDTDQLLKALEAAERELAGPGGKQEAVSLHPQVLVSIGSPTNRPADSPASTVAERMAWPRRLWSFSAKWVLGAALLCVALVFGVTVILETEHGRLIVECPDPTVAVQIERDNRAVSGLEVESTMKDQRTYRIRAGTYRAGTYRVSVPADERDRFEVENQTVTVFRGKDVRVRIRLRQAASTTIADGRGGKSIVPMSSDEPGGPPNWTAPQPPRPVALDWSLVPKTLSGSVSAAAWSPDGELLAVATDTGDCRILRSETLEVVSFLEGHKAHINGIAWCDDGQHLATGGHDHTIRIWSRTGEIRAHIEREGIVVDLAWQPHGRKLACVENSGLVGAIGRGVLFDDMGLELAVFPMDTFYASAVAWSANGRRIATSGSERTVRFWTEHGKDDGAWDRAAPAGSIHWNADGVLAAYGGGVKSFDVRPAAGDRWLQLALPTKPGSRLRWSPDAKWLLVPMGSGVLVAQVQAPADGDAKLTRSAQLTGDLSVVAWHPDSRRFVTAGRSIKLWRLPDANEHDPILERSTDAPPLVAIHRVTWHPKRDEFAVATDHGTVWLRDDRDRRVSEIEAHMGTVTSLAWSPDGEWLATGGADGAVRFWTRHGDPGRVFQDFDAAVGPLRWSHSGSWLAASGGDQSLRLYHPQRGAGPNMSNQQNVAAISWSPDDSVVACGLTHLAGIQFWFAATQFRTWEIVPGGTTNHLRDNVQALAYHPTENRLAAGASYGTLGLLDRDLHHWTPLLKPGEPTAWLHTGSVVRVTWSHRGDRLASADAEGTVGLWTSRGRYVGHLKTGSGVRDMSWSADDRWLAAGDVAGTVWIWDFSGNEGRVVAGHLGSVSSLDWHASQDWLVVGTTFGMIRRFDATSGKVVSTSLLRPDGQPSSFNSTGQVVTSDLLELSRHFLRRTVAPGDVASHAELSAAPSHP